MIVFSKEGSRYGLAVYVGLRQPQDLVLRLYCNDYWPSIDSTVNDFTESKGFGYAPIVMSGSKWRVENGPHAPRLTHDLVRWTFTGMAGKHYGWFATLGFDGPQVMGERFTGKETPYEILVSGDHIEIDPKIDWTVMANK